MSEADLESPLTDDEYRDLCACAPASLVRDKEGKARVPDQLVNIVAERIWLRGLVQPMAVYSGSGYALFFQRTTRGEEVFRELKEAGRG